MIADVTQTLQTAPLPAVISENHDFMNRTCPHCGNQLPYVVDVFCPQCGENLTDPPSTDSSDIPDARQQRANQMDADRGPMFYILTGLGLLIFVITLTRDILQGLFWPQ